jgi:hypothetical protein
MKRVENLITSLTGVLSARVVVTPLGEVSEVHVLTRAGMAPKQVVRNIESALMAQLGFKIDHRKISVAQTADVRPIEALQERRSASGREARVMFKGLEVRRRRSGARADEGEALLARRRPRRRRSEPTRCAIAWKRRHARPACLDALPDN